MAQEVATTRAAPPPIVAMIRGASDDISRALPQGMQGERFIQAFIGSCRKNPTILQCTKASVLDAVLKAAIDGLLLDGREAAITPRKSKIQVDGKDKWVQVAVYVPMFIGLQKRARNSGEISAFLGAHLVYEKEIALNDDGSPSFPSPINGGLRFTYQKGDHEAIFHDPLFTEDAGPIVAGYSLVKLRDGTISREFMTRKQIDAIMMRGSRGAGEPANPVWKTDYEEMAKKTLIRRHCKKLPMDAAASTMFDNLDQAEGYDHAIDAQEVSEVADNAPPAKRLPKKAGVGAAKMAAAAKANGQMHDAETGEVIEPDPALDDQDDDGAPPPSSDAGDYF